MHPQTRLSPTTPRPTTTATVAAASRPAVARLVGAVTAVVLALAALVAGPAGAAQAAEPDRLPLTLTNKTGLGAPSYVYVIGTDLATGRGGHVTRAGTFVAWPEGGNPPAPAPDAAITGPAKGKSVTLHVPRGFSGRVYFSFSRKLPFSLAVGGLVQPAPWAAGDPTRDILFDWSELTYDDGGLWINSSQVDMLAVPHAVAVTDADKKTKRVGDPVKGGRDAVVSALRDDPEWSKSVVTRADGTVLRVLAPGKAADAGLMSADALDAYIARAWAAYSTKTLTVDPDGRTSPAVYEGRTSGDVMTFTDTAGRQVASFTRPSSADVWGCDGALLAPNDQVVGPIARTLCAALNRGTLGTIDTQPSTDGAKFYRSSPTNEYAKAVHAHMKGGKAYAFAFDDVGGFESLVHSAEPRSAAIVLAPLAGTR